MDREHRTVHIANWTEYGRPMRLDIIVELRVGDMAGDLATRGFQTVEHEPCPPGVLTVSVTHELRDKKIRRDDGIVSCGASTPDVPAGAMWADGWSRERYEQLQTMAERWHLNTMRAGCAHQTVRWENDQYGRPRPSLTATLPCPVSGYRYGSAWLVEPVPAEVLDYFRATGPVDE